MEARRSAIESPFKLLSADRLCGRTYLKVWRRDFSRGVAGRISVSSRNKNPTHHNTHRQHEDDVEGYRPCADVAGVPGHCPEQNSEETADPDQSRFQDLENQRCVPLFVVRGRKILVAGHERPQKSMGETAGKDKDAKEKKKTTRTRD